MRGELERICAPRESWNVCCLFIAETQIDMTSPIWVGGGKAVNVYEWKWEWRIHQPLLKGRLHVYDSVYDSAHDFKHD
jgi:hypothetical protein